jgi:hypothetical protein
VRHADLPRRSAHRDLAAAQRLEQRQLQRLGERFLHRPHRIKKLVAFGPGSGLESSHLGFDKGCARHGQAIPRPVLLDVDANAHFAIRARERGVSAAVTQAFGDRLHAPAPHVRA